MEVSSLETSTELDVLEIQNSREIQPSLTKRWSTVSNLAEQSGNEKIRSRTLNGTKSLLHGKNEIASVD